MTLFEKDIVNSLKILHTGGIILYPTDTIWGIGCNATNATAIKKIFLLKKRPEIKSMIILLSHEKEINRYVSDPSPKLIDFMSMQTKPVTGIFENAVNLPDELTGDEGSIAIRIVHDEFCKKLIERLAAPLVSTSANISGNPYPKNYEEVDTIIKDGVDYIVQHRQNEIEMYAPSGIIQLDRNGDIKKIR